MSPGGGFRKKGGGDFTPPCYVLTSGGGRDEARSGKSSPVKLTSKTKNKGAMTRDNTFTTRGQKMKGGTDREPIRVSNKGANKVTTSYGMTGSRSMEKEGGDP